jgi:acyl-CoA reductase-like NAD-dependent aldehyde dehydrogenase
MRSFEWKYSSYQLIGVSMVMPPWNFKIVQCTLRIVI